MEFKNFYENPITPTPMNMLPPLPPTNPLNTCYDYPLFPGGSMGRNNTMPDDYIGVSHRELLKERIRQEMYVDMKKEKVLEEELRREILMERDYLVPKVMLPNHPYDMVLEKGLVNRSSGFFNDGVREIMPFQRHPQAMAPNVESVPQSAKERLLVLPKSNGKASPKIGFANTTKPDLRGALRKLSLSSAKSMGKHIGGKKHQAKITKPKIEHKPNQEVRKAIREKPKSDEKVRPKIDSRNTTEKELRCALCEPSVTSSKTMDDHIRGKKHQAKVAEIKIDQNPNQDMHKALLEEAVPNGKLLPKIDSANTMKPDLRCAVCQVSVSGGKTMDDHIRGKKHQAKVTELKIEQKPTQEKLKALRDENSSLFVKLRECTNDLNKTQLEVNVLMTEKARIEMLYKKNIEDLKKMEEKESKEKKHCEVLRE